MAQLIIAAAGSAIGGAAAGASAAFATFAGAFGMSGSAVGMVVGPSAGTVGNALLQTGEDGQLGGTAQSGPVDVGA